MTRQPLPEDVRQLNETLKRHPELTEAMGPLALLRVPGRTTGYLRSTPVAPLVVAGQRWLVAGFADADWVKNLRHAGWGILTKGTHSERVTVTELPLEEGVPLLHAFLQQMEHLGGDAAGPSGHFAFAITADAPIEAFQTIREQHPIFRLMPVPALDSSDAYFARLVDDVEGCPGVTTPTHQRGFGASALKIHRHIFAMLSHGNLVVKLPQERVEHLLAQGRGARFDPRHDGRLMKEWISLHPTFMEEWDLLAREALEVAATSR